MSELAFALYRELLMDQPHSRDAAFDDAAVTTPLPRRDQASLIEPAPNLGGGRGFTLVELVMVILLLGVMATFSSQFIGIGTPDLQGMPAAASN